MEPTAYSLRFAPASGSSSCLALGAACNQPSYCSQEEVPMTDTMLWPRKTRELHNHHSIPRSGTISSSAPTTSSLQPTPSLERPGCSRSSRRCCTVRIRTLKWQRCRHGSTPRPPAGREAARGGGPNPSTVPQDAPSSGRARLLTPGKVPLSRARWPRRRVESVQSPCEREPEMVCGAQRPPARRAAH